MWSEKVLTGGVGWEGADQLKGGRGRVDGEAGYGSDFDNRRESRRRSRRVGERGRSGQGSRRTSKRASRVQSRVQEPVETQMSMQETGQINSGDTRDSRTSRWIEGL